MSVITYDIIQITDEELKETENVESVVRFKTELAFKGIMNRLKSGGY